jgi:type II secretory pathway predicted ATPase ExeA
MAKKILIIMLALHLLGAVVCAQTKEAREYFNQASIQYISGNLDETIKNLDLALGIDPNYAPARKLKNLIIREKNIQAMKYGTPAPVSPEVKTEIKSTAEVASAAPGPQAGDHYYLFFGLIFSIGFIAFGLLMYYVTRSIFNGKHTAPVNERKCFKCGKKITGNEERCPYCGAYVGLKTWSSISREQKDWYAKLGWHKNPFSLDIFPELMTGHKEKIKEILEKICAKSGHILITGPFGIGKTTLLRWLSYCLPEAQFHTVYIARPPQQFDQLIRYIVSMMGGDVKAMEPQGIYQIDVLRRKLGKNLVLLLDEAHEFTEEIERPLRTLGDLDRVILVMAGLPEAVDKLKTEIQPLYERLVLKVGLDSLNFEEMEAMIKVRIENAGGTGVHPFTSGAIKKIFELSKGVPRTVFKICDAGVTKAMDMGEDKIGAELLENLQVLAP